MSLLQMSLSAACIIAAGCAVRALALNKLPARVFQLFWLVAAARLLVPFSFPSMLSVFNLLEQTPAAQGVSILPAAVPQAVPAAITGGADGAQIPAAPAAGLPPLLTLWLVGMAALAAYFIIANARAIRGFGASLPLENTWVEGWLEENNIRRHVRVRTSDRIRTPLTYGVVRPVILLPASAARMDPAQLRYILTHELLHIKRFDIIKKLVLTACLCVHWFNPMVWVMYVLAGRDIELACDEGVLRIVGQQENAGYAMALIRMQERRGGAAWANSFSRYAIKERITSIMKFKKLSILAMVVVLALVVGVTTAFASSGVPEEAQPVEDGEMTGEISVDSSTAMVMTDDGGVTKYSDDEGQTWMTEEEWEAKYPTPDIVWWTAEEYEAWLNEQRAELPNMIGGKAWNPTDGWYTWTQEDVDEAIAMYEETLQEIKDGVKHSKTVDGRDDIAIAQNVDSAETTSSYGAAIVSDDGTEQSFDDYEDRDVLREDVRGWLDEQVAQGSMTRGEADKVLSDMEQTSASRMETVETA